MSSAAQQPEFFLDRALGKVFASILEDDGWIVHRISSLYPNDAQDVPDEEWISQSAKRGWAMLTKDQHIRYRATELGSLAGGQIFCLASGNLKVAESAEWLLAAKIQIHRAIALGEPGFWKVYEKGRIRRTWP